MGLLSSLLKPKKTEITEKLRNEINKVSFFYFESFQINLYSRWSIDILTKGLLNLYPESYSLMKFICWILNVLHIFIVL